MLHRLADHSSFCFNSNMKLPVILIFLSRDGLEFVEIKENKEKQNLDPAPPNIYQFMSSNKCRCHRGLKVKTKENPPAGFCL